MTNRKPVCRSGIEAGDSLFFPFDICPRLAIRGIEGALRDAPADSFRHDRRFNFEPRTSNFELRDGPPFNMSDWGGARTRELPLSALIPLAHRMGEGSRVGAKESGARVGVRCLTLAPPACVAEATPSRQRPGGNANRCKVPTARSELRNLRGLNWTIELGLSESAPPSNQSGEGEIRKAIIEAQMWKINLKTTPL